MNSHLDHRMHRHSLDAYLSEKMRLSARARAVYLWVLEHGMATDRQIMRGLGFTDPNSVRPRVTELVDALLLSEVGETRDAETGKTVRLVDLRKSQGELAL